MTQGADYRQLYEGQLARCSELEATVSALRKENRLLRLSDAHMPNSGFEWLTNLQYRVKDLSAQVRDFQSGRRYIRMKQWRIRELETKDGRIKQLESALADANARNATNSSNWMQALEDLEKCHAKEIKKKDAETDKQKERALRAERRLDETKDKLLEKTRGLYAALTELEDEKGKNMKLKSQINRDHENSSKPSSMVENRKKITNNREKSGKKPGGQIGHEHHPRRTHAPTEEILVPIPKEFLDDTRYRLTGNVIAKQFVDIKLDLIVSEYRTPVLYDMRAGTYTHAELPFGLTDDVTYGGNLKAFAFLLNNYCNVSIDKTMEIVSELTGGKLQLSKGMINGLSAEFSRKTEDMQKKAFADMLLAPVMHVDFTGARVDGKQANVLVCATPDSVLYFPRWSKGHKGVMGSPLEDFLNTVIHDHDKTFYSYGGLHQECMDHVLRYLKDSIINEPNLKWNTLMRGLIREMIHFRKSLDLGDERNPDEIAPETVAAFEARYDEILGIAKDEYEYEPPSKYYMKGHGLFRRLGAYKDAHLLFLHDRRVPYSNSLSERMLRIYKRKQHQAMTFRSFSGLEMLCNSLGVIATLRSRGESMFDGVSKIFSKAAS